MLISKGNNVVINENVKIGKNVKIGNNVIIHSNTIISDNVIIMDNAVIGKSPSRAKTSILPKVKDLPGCNIESGVTIGTSAIIYVNANISEDTFIADLATVRERVNIGKGTIIGRGVSIENDTEIGEFCKLETNCYITAYSVIEDFVFIAPCVTFTNDNYMGRTKERLSKFKGPHIKKGGRIGANSTILPGIVIHEDAAVAAASVVTKDVLAGKLVLGVPAKVIRDVSEEQLLKNQ